jgi:single-strand DNA-binding protein
MLNRGRELAATVIVESVGQDFADRFRHRFIQRPVQALIASDAGVERKALLGAQACSLGKLATQRRVLREPHNGGAEGFRVASTPRVMDRTTNEWKDGDSLFLTCNVWRQAAENVAESLQRGMRVIVSGRLRQRSYETKEGEKRTVYEIEVDEVGPSLRNASAKVTRSQRSGGFGGQGGPSGPGGQGGYGGGAGGRAAASEDPWATEPAGDSGFTDEPPF